MKFAKRSGKVLTAIVLAGVLGVILLPRMNRNSGAHSGNIKKPANATKG